MRINRIFTILFLSTLPLLTQGQTYTLFLPLRSNYVHTTVPQQAMTSVPASNVAHDPSQVSEQVQYFDGLGRPLQTVQVAGSPNKKDIIQPVAYDEVGREAVKYLPYVDVNGTADGSFRGNALLYNNTVDTYTNSDQYKFYQMANINIATDASPFAKTVFEPSPLNRVLEQGAPGVDWQPGTGHTQKVDYQTNLANDVLLFSISGTSLSTAIAYYGAAQLYVTQHTDEDGHVNKEYKDKEGQVVFKRVIDGTNKLDTYYVYDNFGLLRFVLPPEAIDKINKAFSATPLASGAVTNITASITKNSYENTSYVVSKGSTLTLGNGFHFNATPGTSFSVTNSAQLSQTDQYNLIYQYQYDERKRMIVKKMPGADEVYMVYDKRDRLVLTQDGNMRLANGKQWNFIKYDALNRPVVTGIYTHSAIADQTAMQTYLDNTIYPTTGARTYFVTRNNTGTTGYTDVSFPISTDGALDYLTVTFYDRYGFPGVRGFNTTANNISGVATNSTLVIGQVTGSKERVLGTSLFLTTTNYYDTKYRPIQVLRDLYDGGNAITSSELVCNNYDFVGKVRQTRQVQTFNAVATTVDKYLTYDHAGRLTKTEMQIGGDATGKVAIAEQTYNEVGQLIDKKLHKTATGNYNQSIDYKYNIRGWLTQINDPGGIADTSDPSPDLFAERLHYNTVESTTLLNPKLYNGNISAQVWNNNGEIQAYQYTYDQLNRITSGDYKTYSTVWTDGSKYDEGGITYDLNGNILTLKRTDEAGKYTGTNGANYNYDYTGYGNKLKSINGGATYLYDNNGNMTFDGRTGNAFEYNVLNLPQKVYKGTDKLKYTYSATGQKLLKSYVVNGSATTNQYYVGNMVYGNTNKALEYIIFEEGVIRKLSNGYSWEYNLKDHLGNTRAVFIAGATAPSSVKQTSDYYPFGEVFAPRVKNDAPANKYLYNGKELQDDKLDGSSLNMVDYGARFYDAAIGRFHTVDPMAFKYFHLSPYNYCANNPIAFIDPDGRVIKGVTKDDANKTQEDLNTIFADDKYANFRNLLSLDKKGKTFNSIGVDALTKALNGVELSADEQALVDIVVNSINSEDVHLIEFANKDENISSTGQGIMSGALPKALVDPVISANGGIPASIISAFGGSGVTTATKNGTYTLMIEGLDASKSGSDYLNASGTYVNSPGGRATTTGHELFGHGRSLVVGRTNPSIQHVDAIKTENLMLRIMGHGSIQRDGTGHGPGTKVANPSGLPEFR